MKSLLLFLSSFIVILSIQSCSNEAPKNEDKTEESKDEQSKSFDLVQAEYKIPESWRESIEEEEGRNRITYFANTADDPMEAFFVIECHPLEQAEYDRKKDEFVEGYSMAYSSDATAQISEIEFDGAPGLQVKLSSERDGRPLSRIIQIYYANSNEYWFEVNCYGEYAEKAFRKFEMFMNTVKFI